MAILVVGLLFAGCPSGEPASSSKPASQPPLTETEDSVTDEEEADDDETPEDTDETPDDDEDVI